MSRHHLLLRPRHTGWELVNRSSNGILVDERPTEHHRLTGPAVVSLGQHPDAPQITITPLDEPATGLPTKLGGRVSASAPTPYPPATRFSPRGH